MVDEPSQPGGPLPAHGPGDMFRIPLRPGEAPCEIVAGLVRYLQRRFDLDVVDYDLVGERAGVVHLSRPDRSELFRRLEIRCRRSLARAEQLVTRNSSMRAESRTLLAEKRRWIEAIDARRRQYPRPPAWPARGTGPAGSREL
jgi:hypothetical protein